MRTGRRERTRARDAEELRELLERGQRVCVGDRVADGARRREDLEVVAALEGLVAKEVDLVKVGLGQVLQAVRLVPARREQVERDLAADRVGEVVVGKLLLQFRLRFLKPWHLCRTHLLRQQSFG